MFRKNTLRLICLCKPTEPTSTRTTYSAHPAVTGRAGMGGHALGSRALGFVFTISLLLQGLLTACHTAGEPDAASLNCHLETPPADSGEMAGEGGQLRIYPRSTEMPPHYSGCQTAWAEDRSTHAWIVMVQTHYLKGSVTELRTIDSLGEKLCRYNHGTRVEGPRRCPSFKTANGREASLPPGCLETLAHSAQDENVPCLLQYQ